MEFEIITEFAKANPELAFYAFMTVYTIRFWRAQKDHSADVSIIVAEVIKLNSKLDKVISDTDRRLIHLQSDVDDIASDLSRLDEDCRKVITEVESLKKFRVMQ